MIAGFDQREFINAWCEECARAIEMFSGEKATVVGAAAATDAASLLELKDLLWWKQRFRGARGELVTWLGASEPTWSALGAGTAADGAAAKDVYLEVIGQAEQGTATLLSRKLGWEVRCEGGEIQQTAPAASKELWEIQISLPSGKLPSILCSMDCSGLQSRALSTPENTKSLERLAGAAERSYSPGVDQFLDLELPLSVVLGRCIMQIQDVLKLTSGSVVELDSTVSDRAEIIVQGKLVARGEVVSVKGNYGVRITDIVPGRIGWN